MELLHEGVDFLHLAGLPRQQIVDDGVVALAQHCLLHVTLEALDRVHDAQRLDLPLRRGGAKGFI